MKDPMKQLYDFYFFGRIPARSNRDPFVFIKTYCPEKKFISNKKSHGGISLLTMVSKNAKNFL